MYNNMYYMVYDFIILYYILTMRTANGCMAPTVWRPWAQPRRLLLLQRRRKRRRPARRRVTTAVGFCARDPQKVVWSRRAFFSDSRTRLKRTQNHIFIMKSNKNYTYKRDRYTMTAAAM